MRKICLLASLLVVSQLCFSQSSNRLLDWPMKLTNMSVRINTNAFTATTTIEMDFCNPNNVEIEGLYRFELEAGQVITDFKLELNGKYRDGSIEEKWKARNAYNTIVGKRVDPALLELEYANHYRLNIYPIPANGCRKVIITILQAYKSTSSNTQSYSLPLNVSDTVKKIDLSINSQCGVKLQIAKGLLANKDFVLSDDGNHLQWHGKNVRIDKPIAFSQSLIVDKPMVCIKQMKEKDLVALKAVMPVERYYTIHPKNVTVFWDVSATDKKRDIAKEIDLLDSYCSKYDIENLTLITFKQNLQDTIYFKKGENFKGVRKYLAAQHYEGAAQIGNINLSAVQADAVLLFTPGINSYGKNVPTAGKVHIYCISSSEYSLPAAIQQLVTHSGGQSIRLQSIKNEEALVKLGLAENVLLDVKGENESLELNSPYNRLRNDTLYFTGAMPKNTRTLTFCYGNNTNILQQRIINLDNGCTCEESNIDRLDMLFKSESDMNGGYWYDMLEYGKKERIVTYRTSFIVLERIEDYIRYNIMPPAELHSECDMQLFVKADVEKRNQFKLTNETDVLREVVIAYNKRISQADKTGNPIVFNDRREMLPVSAAGETSVKSISGKASGVNTANYDGYVTSGTEVVVTALGVARVNKELGYSTTRVRSAELTQAKPVNFQNGLTGKVAGLNVQTVNNGVFADTRITLRGIRSLTGNNQPMLVLNGVPINLNNINLINPNDIIDVVVLKSASATAIYGPDGVNGALVVTTKKGSRWRGGTYAGTYKLKSMQDEDYIADIRNTSDASLWEKYKELKREYAAYSFFYLDMSEHFYKRGFRTQAIDILFSAATINGGNKQVLEAIGFILESWKEYEEAEKVYQNLLQEQSADLKLYRNLALIGLQQKDYAKAVNMYYKGIRLASAGNESAFNGLKAMMLQEMNAIISTYKDKVDVSEINQQLLRPIDYDFRITLDCNSSFIGRTVSIKEPGGYNCVYGNKSYSKGQLTDGLYASYWNSEAIEEYQVKNPERGKYKVSVKYYDYLGINIPAIVRIVSFKKRTGGLDLSIENVILNNQYGDIEIGEVKW